MTKRITEQQAADLLLAADNILLLAHHYPDGDTVGSNYALCLALRSLGKQVRVLCGDPIPERFDYLTEGVAMPDFAPDFICAVDVADARLLGDAVQAEYGHRVDLCIDHHSANEAYAAYTCVDDGCAAAAMLVMRIIPLLGVEITPAIAACLYTGIATDTGCFKFSNTTAETHRMAAECIAVGIPHDYINRMHFDVKSRARIELERLALEQMEYCYGDRVALMAITKEMIARTGATENDLDGLTPIPRQIEGVWVGVTLRQKEDGNYKISVRTGHHADATAICAQLDGGGHLHAAGCTFEGNLAEAKAAILTAIEQVIPRIKTN